MNYESKNQRPQTMKNQIFKSGDELIVGLVYQTKDYDIFQCIRGNRNININNVLKIAISIKKMSQIEPIVIDSNFFVIDGQHRLEACRSLRIPVKFYAIQPNRITRLEYVETVNTERQNWGWRDRLRMYTTKGNENYKNYEKLIKRFAFPHTAMLTVVLFQRQKKDLTNIFNKGELKIKEDIINIIERLEFIEDCWKLSSRAYSNMPGKNKKTPPAHLIIALVSIMKHENFSYETMINKLKNDVSGIVGINSIGGFQEQLIKIYNWNNRGQRITI